jgi:AmmeMemoRadiSam system protein B/AmmeMemoRadiSam system protein A
VKKTLLYLFLLAGCASSNEGSQNVREPAVAGAWYPGDKQELQEMIDTFLSQVETERADGEIHGIIVPHAGYAFSGQTAAYAFKQIEGRGFKTVFILGPYHGPKKAGAPVSFRGVSVWRSGAYRTPLGLVEIDSEIADGLISFSDRIQFIPEVHREEHSIEMQIPFLQSTLKDFKIVPLLMTDQSLETCKILADAIVSVMGKLPERKALFVASSDFYHGYDYEECKKSTEKSSNLLSDFDIDGFFETFQKENAACGGGAITTTMLVAKQWGAKTVLPLYATNSGDVTGKKEGWIVGYGSFLIAGKGHQEWEPLDAEAQEELVKMARESIESQVKTGKTPLFQSESGFLDEKRGVFVTIRTKDGALRGCIGHHQADAPLRLLVPKMAIAAATQDYRFPALTEPELKSIKIKLSVYLCEVHAIKDIAEYEPGKHGIIMKKGGRAATFLPEVPTEQNWTKETTLNQLCLKAGLPSDGWKQGAEFHVYSTQVFGE